jgi:NAD(P)-dependent dehydrogenase (short-subunit alcohol dehydrogenase family)
MNEVKGRTVLVVGASSGVGRDIAEALAARGARVAFAARRAALVQEAAQGAGDDCIGIACDVRDEASCKDVVAKAVDAFGALDTLVYASAVGPLADLRTATAETWREALDINLVGASLVTAAAVDHLEASSAGKAIYLSSITGSTSTPWPGLAVYAVSKAALDRLVDAWRIEHPTVRFTSIALGPMMSQNGAPGTFAVGWDAAKAGASIERWTSLGLIDGSSVNTSDLCEQVLAILTTDASISRVIVEP